MATLIKGHRPFRPRGEAFTWVGQGMGRCKYCGKWAVLSRRKHKECKANFWKVYKEIMYVTQQSVLERIAPLMVEKKVMEIASDGRIPMELMKHAIAKGFVGALSLLLKDHVLSGEEEEALIGFMDFFVLTEKDADAQCRGF